MCDNISYGTEIQASNHFSSGLSTPQTEIRTLRQESNAEEINFQIFKVVKQQKYHFIMKSKKPNYFLKKKNRYFP